MRTKAIKLNEEAEVKFAALDKNKVYIFEIEVGDTPREEVDEILKKYKSVITKAGINGIYVPTNHGIGCVNATEIKQYLKKLK